MPAAARHPAQAGSSSTCRWTSWAWPWSRGRRIDHRSEPERPVSRVSGGRRCRGPPTPTPTRTSAVRWLFSAPCPAPAERRRRARALGTGTNTIVRSWLQAVPCPGRSPTRSQWSRRQCRVTARVADWQLELWKWQSLQMDSTDIILADLPCQWHCIRCKMNRPSHSRPVALTSSWTVTTVTGKALPWLVRRRPQAISQWLPSFGMIGNLCFKWIYFIKVHLKLSNQHLTTVTVTVSSFCVLSGVQYFVIRSPILTVVSNTSWYDYLLL